MPRFVPLFSGGESNQPKGKQARDEGTRGRISQGQKSQGVNEPGVNWQRGEKATHHVEGLFAGYGAKT